MKYIYIYKEIYIFSFAILIVSHVFFCPFYSYFEMKS